MGASSVTGVSGPGSVARATSGLLETVAAGAAQADTPGLGGFVGTVVFEPPLPGPSSDYVINCSGGATVTGLSESVGKFTGFSFRADIQSEVIFTVKR